MSASNQTGFRIVDINGRPFRLGPDGNAVPIKESPVGSSAGGRQSAIATEGESEDNFVSQLDYSFRFDEAGSVNPNQLAYRFRFREEVYIDPITQYFNAKNRKFLREVVLTQARREKFIARAWSNRTQGEWICFHLVFTIVLAIRVVDRFGQQEIAN